MIDDRIECHLTAQTYRSLDILCITSKRHASLLRCDHDGTIAQGLCLSILCGSAHLPAVLTNTRYSLASNCDRRLRFAVTMKLWFASIRSFLDRKDVIIGSSHPIKPHIIHESTRNAKSRKVVTLLGNVSAPITLPNLVKHRPRIAK